MRLFVGTFLSDSLQHAYAMFVDELVGRHPRILRSIPLHSAHITHVFCADADESALDGICRAVGNEASVREPIPIRLGAPRILSARSQPRLVCADIVSGGAGLQRLGGDILRRLHTSLPGLQVRGSREPHVTLARFRKLASQGDAHAVSRSLDAGPGSREETATSIEQVDVVVSELTPAGPVYHVKARLPLQTSPS